MVLRKFCVAFAAALTLGSAQAATYNFTYQGFFDDGPATWLPNYTLSGKFTGNDADSNGIISLAELTQFSIGGYELLANPDCPNYPVGLLCSVNSFSYHLTGALQFDASESYHDEVLGHFTDWVTGDSINYYHYGPTGSTSRTLYWTEDTILTLSPAPIAAVPEPSIAAMAAVGALLLTGRRLRQRSHPL